MEVDTPAESTKPEVPQVDDVPPPKPKPQPIEELLPAPIVQVDSVPSKMVEQPDVEGAGVSAAADTTTIVAAKKPPQNNIEVIDAIDVHSSDDDSKEPSVTNSQVIVNQPDAVVELESSSNEGDNKPQVVAKTQQIDSLELELINSDSSHSANDIQIDEIPASQVVPEQSLPTSTVEPDVTEVTAIVDEPAIATNNNANDSVHSYASSQISVVSTNDQTLIALPEKVCTITGKISMISF